MTVVGATPSLPHGPAKVRLLNQQPALELGGGDYPSCPTADPTAGSSTIRFLKQIVSIFSRRENSILRSGERFR